MESMGQKHNLQFLEEHDEESYGLGDSKVPGMDDSGDEVATFFALMDRIRTTKKILKQKCPEFDPAEARSTEAENIEAKIQTSPSSWKPSFEWEDFSKGDMMFGANFGSSNGRDFANNDVSSSKEIRNPDMGSIRNPDMGSNESGKLGFSDKYGLVGSIDLNAEAPSDNPVPSPL